MSDGIAGIGVVLRIAVGGDGIMLENCRTDIILLTENEEIGENTGLDDIGDACILHEVRI